MEDPLFEKVIKEVLKELPPDLKAALATVQILVQEEPSPDQLKRSGLRAGDELFGLFDGLSLKDWPLGRDRQFPDRVILFKGSLQRYYPKREDLTREIRKTLIHELGHFFGFSEKELKDRGLG
jgi:predicted Zn-dependent protease with MMP-like domain